MKRLDIWKVVLCCLLGLNVFVWGVVLTDSLSPLWAPFLAPLTAPCPGGPLCPEPAPMPPP